MRQSQCLLQRFLDSNRTGLTLVFAQRTMRIFFLRAKLFLLTFQLASVLSTMQLPPVHSVSYIYNSFARMQAYLEEDHPPPPLLGWLQHQVMHHHQCHCHCLTTVHPMCINWGKMDDDDDDYSSVNKMNAPAAPAPPNSKKDNGKC